MRTPLLYSVKTVWYATAAIWYSSQTVTLSIRRCGLEQLSAEGISARVVDVHTVKPLDREDVIRHASETGAVVTCEEHQVIGGLGSAVCETLSEKRLRTGRALSACRTALANLGTPEELIDKYGLGVDSLCAAARRAVQRKTSR